MVGEENKAQDVVREEGGVRSYCIINRIYMFFLSTCFVGAFGIIALPLAFAVGGGMSVVGGAIIPYVEEKSRRLLVDHLEDNEIRKTGKIFRLKRK